MPGPQSAPDLPSVGAEADPLLGRVLNDRYRILEVIGHGGMGRVYKALQTPLDRLVALKILAAGHDRDPNFYKRFFLKASVTARLTHPNTITLYDYGRTEDGIFFIAMEFLDGRTLSQAMQQEGPLAQERVIHVAQQICRSLREAHALGIIHRDLKPANVMLLRQHDDHDFVKVLDFGLVKERADRFQSMDELLGSLKLVRQQLSGAAGAFSAPPPVTPDSLRPVAARTPSAPLDSPRTPAEALPSVTTTSEGGSRAVRPPPVPADALEERARWHRFTGMGDPPASVRSIWLTTGAAVLAAAALAVWMGGARRQRPKPTVTVEHTARVVVGAPPSHPAYQPASAGVTLVTLTSAPTGAEVNDADGRALGHTPMDPPVSAGRPLQLVLKLDGYKPFPVLRRSLSGDRIEIAATLKKEPSKVEPQPPPVRRSVGYRDDPY